MRFADTLDGWHEQLGNIRANPHLSNFIRAISRDEPQIIRVEKKDDETKYAPIMCHDNVNEHVSRFGGQQIFGWIIRPWTISNETEFDGMLMAVFHSNWLSPNGELISVTPEPTNYHIFIRDQVRRFNFDTLESFNNRAIYLDSYKPKYGAANPSRNVNYFIAGSFADRDRGYERYRIPQPSEKVEDLLPQSLIRNIDGSPRISPEGQKYLSLKYSIEIGS